MLIFRPFKDSFACRTRRGKKFTLGRLAKTMDGLFVKVLVTTQVANSLGLFVGITPQIFPRAHVAHIIKKTHTITNITV